MKKEEQEKFMARYRKMNEQAGEYATVEASDLFRARKRRGSVKLTQRDLVAIVRTAWIAGYQKEGVEK